MGDLFYHEPILLPSTLAQKSVFEAVNKGELAHIKAE